MNPMNPDALDEQVSDDMPLEVRPVMCPFSGKRYKKLGDVLVSMMCFLYGLLLLILSTSMM